MMMKKLFFSILFLILSFHTLNIWCYPNHNVIKFKLNNVKDYNFRSEETTADSETDLTETANLLFKNVKCKLTITEKIRICKLLEINISKDKKQFTAKYDKTQEEPFYATVYITNLNKDKNEEVFVAYGNTYTSGMAGQEIVLFIKDNSGMYQKNLGFGGLVPDALKSNYKGYPDLLIGGPGFQTPIWRWDGSRYKYLISIKGNKLSKGISIEEISKKYNSNF